MMGFQEMITHIKYYSKNEDTELAHIECDKILKKAALHTGLSKEQRKEIVKYWEECKKWHS